MKKILTLAVVVAFSAGIIGCGNETPKAKDAKTNPPSTTDKPKADGDKGATTAPKS